MSGHSCSNSFFYNDAPYHNRNFKAKDFQLEDKGAEFGQLCVNACRILPLLQLKNFLRKAYNLSENRMTEYVPSEKERINEKGVSISDSVTPFSCNFAPLFDGEKIRWAIAAKIYTQFRVLMRDDEKDELQVDDTKKSPKRGGKRKNDRAASPKVSPDAE